MRCGLWGHALALAAAAERRTRALVAARFLAALPRADPLHTLHAALQAKAPPAATVRIPAALAHATHYTLHTTHRTRYMPIINSERYFSF